MTFGQEKAPPFLVLVKYQQFNLDFGINHSPFVDNNNINTDGSRVFNIMSLPLQFMPFLIQWRSSLYLAILVIKQTFLFGNNSASNKQATLLDDSTCYPNIARQLQKVCLFQSNSIIILLSAPQMKQSYLRHKVQLKPLNNADFGSKKTIVDYQQYQQQLSAYEKKKKNADIASLFDWTKPSEIISLQQRQSSVSIKEPQPIQNNSMNTEELLRSDNDPSERHSHRSDEFDDSIEVELNSGDEHRPTYSDEVTSSYAKRYTTTSEGQLEKEMKEMRERIIEMNTKLNHMLNRYQLLSGAAEPKEIQITDPYKFFSKQIHINAKILAKQEYQKASINFQDKQLEKKDYLVELNDMIAEIGKQIHDTGHEKHNKWVDTERIDKLLKQIQSIQASDEEYRSLRQLKLKTVFYFKKLKERKDHEEQLDQQLERLIEKERTITAKLQFQSKLAVQRCLEVSTNKQFLELKKKHEELATAVEAERRKKDIVTKSFKITEDKIEKDMQAMVKEMQSVQMQTQEIEYKSITVEEETNTLMEKHNLHQQELKSISYRFDSSLIHPEPKRFKPDFRRASRVEGDQTNRTIDVLRGTLRKFTSINDKNMTMEAGPENAENTVLTNRNAIQMKPILKSVKGRMDKARYSVDNSRQNYKTVETANIFKPNFMIKLKK